MLRKQQASAMVAARKVIVEGVVDIAYSAIQKLEARGIDYDYMDDIFYSIYLYTYKESLWMMQRRVELLQT